MKKTSKLRLIKDYKEELNYRILAFTLFVIIICILFLWGANGDWKNLNDLRIVFISFVSTVLSLAIVFVFWEVGGKRSFAKDILDLAKISNNIIDSGIDYYYPVFEDINWKEELENKKKLDIIVVSGYTFLNTNRKYLKEMIQDGGEINVFLPNYNNQEIVKHYADAFSYTHAQMENNIKDAVKGFQKVKVKVFLYNRIIKTSFYMYDNTVITAPFHHQDGKPNVPAIRASRPGQYYDFIETEINAIKNHSELIGEENEK